MENDFLLKDNSNETKVNSVEKDVITRFIESWSSLIFFSSILLAVSLIQLLLFVLSDGTISGSDSDGKTAWVSWAYILVSFPFGVVSSVSMILSIRGHKHFFYWTLGVELGYFISGLAGGLMFSGIIMLSFIIINTIRFVKIKKEGPDYNINESLVNWITLALVIGVLVVGFVSIELDSNNVFWWNTEVYNGTKTVQYIDVVTSAITLVGVMFMLSKNKHGFIMFMLCDTLYLFLFISAHQWSNLAITIMFITVEILGFIVWHNRDVQKQLNNEV